MHWIICPMHSCRTWNLASLYLVVSFSPSETSTLGRYATRPTASLLPELQFITCTQIGLALLLPTPVKKQIQFTKRRCSFQNIPVSPPSHDRLNSATFPRAGIVFVALSSRRLYSIPRPYIRSSFTGCFNTCVFHTKSCPCLCSFLAYFVVCTGFKTQMRVSKHKCKTYLYRFQNTNTRCKTHMRVSKHKCKT